MLKWYDLKCILLLLTLFDTTANECKSENMMCKHGFKLSVTLQTQV